MHYLEYVMHIDKYLNIIVEGSGVWVYVLLAFAVFCETGLFMAPFMPEESLLFVTGALAAAGTIDIRIITIVLICANVFGETVNFFIGKFLGPQIFRSNNSFLFNKKHIERTAQFYKKHGGKSVLIAKFIPLIRTFVPFTAGMSNMKFSYFITYNMLGGIPWVLIFLFGGYYFGNMPIVQDNFGFVILLVVIISVSPGLIAYFRNKKAKSIAIEETELI